MAIGRTGLGSLSRALANALALAGLLLLAVTAAAVVIEPMPRALDERQLGLGMVVEDTAGRQLIQIRNKDYLYAHPVRLTEIPRQLERALIVAEDARFLRHRGVDPLAIGRALWQLLTRRRIVSGASTLTQQLARSLVARPRTFYGKWREAVVALRIETDLDKSAILESYLNQVPFGSTSRGIGAASEGYFGKPLSALSLAEVAALAALPKGPVAYHPRRAPERLLLRRNWILERMVAAGAVERDAATRAQLEPLTLREQVRTRTALHLSRAIAQGRFDDEHQRLSAASRVQTTLDGRLQTQIEKLVTDAKGDLTQVGATAVCAVVLDNERSDLLAYVGSVDFFDPQSLGQNDGCLALRQPGSVLKPFLYAAGIDWLGLGSATALYDVETPFHEAEGTFTPRNYDGRFHGLVLLREALGSSLNVPAVAVAERVVIERWLSQLRDLGFRSLTRPAADYGLALALGDGEVRPIELAEAYATLGRRGWHRTLRIAQNYTDRQGERHEVPFDAGHRSLSEAAAVQILEILSDDSARAPAFGRHGILDLGFAAATKTGTSSNHRDNWAVGVTHEVTVVVWVGNFDGRALNHGASGVVGAAPLMRAVLRAAMGERPRAPLYSPEWLQPRRICKISGQDPGAECPEIVEVLAVKASKTPSVCTLHRRVPIDPENGLLAGSNCPGAVEQTFEFYPDALVGWAHSAGRPTPPVDVSPRCAGPRTATALPMVALKTPQPGDSYLQDPQLQPSQQQLRFAVTASADTAWVRYAVDGVSSGRIRPPFQWLWPLRAGKHRVTVASSEGATDAAVFQVR